MRAVGLRGGCEAPSAVSEPRPLVPLSSFPTSHITSAGWRAAITFRRSRASAALRCAAVNSGVCAAFPISKAPTTTRPAASAASKNGVWRRDVFSVYSRSVFAPILAIRSISRVKISVYCQTK